MKLNFSTTKVNPDFQNVSTREDISRSIGINGPRNTFLHLPQQNAYIVPRSSDVYHVVKAGQLRGNLPNSGITIVRFCYEYYDSRFLGVAAKAPQKNDELSAQTRYSRSLSDMSWPSALADRGLRTLVDVVVDAYRFPKLPYKENYDVKYKVGGFVTLDPSDPKSASQSSKQIEIYKTDLINLSSVLSSLPSENLVYLINRGFFLYDIVFPNITNRKIVRQFKEIMLPVLKKRPLTVLATASNYKYFASSFFIFNELFNRP
ncbi:MAG: hypothetical protein V1843_02540 [bacterium]